MKTSPVALIFMFCTAGAAAFASVAFAADPRIAITSPQGGTFEMGHEIKIEWTAENIPEGSSLVLYAGVSGGDPKWGGGAGGPLMLRAVPLANGPGAFIWDGKGLGCAPTDYPTFCPIDPGEYHLGARVYDRSDFAPVTGLPIPGQPLHKANVIASAYSAPIVLHGAPDFRQMTRALRGYVTATLTKIAEPRAYFIPAVNPSLIERYTREEGPPKQVSEYEYCLKSMAVEPFAGEIEVCQRLRQEPTIRSSTATLAPGILSLVEASRRAEAMVKEQYAGKARPELRTKIDIHRTDWVYKSSAHTARPHWGILHYVGETGGSESIPDRFAIMVYVKVFNDGTTEMVELPRIPKTSGTNVDIWNNSDL